MDVLGKGVFNFCSFCGIRSRIWNDLRLFITGPLRGGSDIIKASFLNKPPECRKDFLEELLRLKCFRSQRQPFHASESTLEGVKLLLMLVAQAFRNLESCSQTLCVWTSKHESHLFGSSENGTANRGKNDIQL